MAFQMGMMFNSNSQCMMGMSQAQASAFAGAFVPPGPRSSFGHPHSCPRPNYSWYNQTQWGNSNSNCDGAANSSSTDNGQFHFKLNVKAYKPCELKVKIVDNCVVVEGKHDERSDEQGSISRHFVRKYPIPEGINANQIVATLSSDGVLTIRAPTSAQQTNRNERIIEIQQTGTTHDAPGPSASRNESEGGGAETSTSTEETTAKT